MAEPNLVKTGISGLDAILSSGIPRGNVILLEGGIGTGKTTMGVEFVYRGASAVRRTRHHRPVRSLARQTRARCGGFGWDLRALERERKLKIIFTTRQVFRQELQQADSLLLEEAAEIGARRIYVDGVAGAASAVGERGASRLLSRPRRRAAARKPHGRLRGRSERDRRRPWHRAARRIDCRHGRPVENGRAVPRHGAVDRDRQVARARLSDGPALVPDRRWPRASRCTGGCRPLAGRAASTPQPSIRRRACPPALPASMRW